MDTRQIRYFLAVVEHGGFGRAAAALNVAQPTMSQSVKALERDLGTALFHRASHGVTLSAAGRAFLGPARLLMRDVAVAGEAVGGRPEHDSLEIVASAPLGAHPGAALVGGFLRAHPGVSVSLDRDTEEALLARVRDGVSELGLVHLPAARLGLCEVELGAHDLVLVFPPPDTARPGGTRPASRRPGPPDAKPPAGPPATPRLTNLTAMAHQTDLTTAAHQAGLTDTTHQAGLIEATRQTHLTSAASQAGLSDAARRTDLTGATHQAGSAPAPRRTDSTGAPHPADVNSAARQAGPSGVALRPGRPEAPRQADLTGDARPAGSPDTAHEADPPGVTRHPGPPGTAGRTDLAGVARQAEGAHLAGVVRWGNPAGMVRRSGQGGGVRRVRPSGRAPWEGADLPAAVHLADLAGVDLLGVPRGSASRLLVESALRAAGVRTRIVVESGQRDLITELVIAGVGAAFMPDVAAHEAVARGAVVRRVVPALRLPYGLVHRSGELSATARAFIDHVLRQG